TPHPFHRPYATVHVLPAACVWREISPKVNTFAHRQAVKRLRQSLGVDSAQVRFSACRSLPCPSGLEHVLAARANTFANRQAVMTLCPIISVQFVTIGTSHLSLTTLAPCSLTVSCAEVLSSSSVNAFANR